MSKNFDTTPKPYFLQAMRNQSWTVTGALAELVDNSFGPGRGNADTCYITYVTKTRTLTVVDDGAGMSNIGRLFQLGNTIGRSPGDIGLYGSGGTMALLWLGESAQVFTLVNGMVASDKVTWADSIAAEQFPTIDESWRPASIATCPPELLEARHGTAILLQLAPERGAMKVDQVRRDLAKIYAPGIRAGKKIVWTTVGKNGQTGVLADPIAMPGDTDKVVNFDFVIARGDSDLPVTGQVGIVDGVTSVESGIHIGYGSRVIVKTKDCFSSSDGSETYTGSSVTGWLDLGDGWQPYLSTTKNALNDKPLWDVLMGYVFTAIEPLLREADDEKLTLELDDIALALQNLFDGAATVSVSKKVEEVDAPEGGRGDTVDDPVDDTPTDTETDDDPDGPKQDKPAKAEIHIMPKSDAQIGGVLCLATPLKGATATITVEVNKDHPMVALALLQKPVNRSLLNQIVVSEIANVLAADADMCQIAFKKKIAESIAGIDDPVHRERKVLRLLADYIPPKAS